MSRRPVTDYIKPGVKAIKAYTLQDYKYELKINQNENPCDVPEEIKREIFGIALERSWSRYPSFNPETLKLALASYTGWKPEGILAGNGSNELIQACLTVFLNPGEKLVLPTPTFSLYKQIGAVLGAEIAEVPLKNDYSFDCDAIESEFLGGGKVLVICTPNNPTGSLCPRERIEALLEKTDLPVILDEAYYEFSQVTAVDLLDKYENLIILRTFSKAFSLAGLRVGYAMMNPDAAREVNKAVLPYNLNFFSQAAAEKLLAGKELLNASIEEIISERDRVFDQMNKMENVKPYPSRANYILFETPYNPDDVFKGLLDRGVLVRNVSGQPMLSNSLRVSISVSSDNDRFLTALRETIEEISKGG